MSLMLGKHAALRIANVPDDKAIEAAEEVAAYDNRLARIELNVNLLTWMVGFNIALTVVFMGKLFLK